MTCREKLKLEHPDKVNDGHTGGCEGCPDCYGYLRMPIYCPGDGDTKICTKCWNREIPMTPEEFAERMREIVERYGCDAESSHGAMDGIMCELLKSLGYEEGVNIFGNSKRFYA